MVRRAMLPAPASPAALAGHAAVGAPGKRHAESRRQPELAASQRRGPNEGKLSIIPRAAVPGARAFRSPACTRPSHVGQRLGRTASFSALFLQALEAQD